MCANSASYCQRDNKMHLDARIPHNLRNQECWDKTLVPNSHKTTACVPPVDSPIIFSCIGAGEEAFPAPWPALGRSEWPWPSVPTARIVRRGLPTGPSEAISPVIPGELTLPAIIYSTSCHTTRGGRGRLLVVSLHRHESPRAPPAQKAPDPATTTTQ